MEISPKVLQRIRREQEIEQIWWGEEEAVYTSQSDVLQAIDEGRLVAVKHPPDSPFRISAHVHSHFRVLAPAAFRLLQWVGDTWAEGLEQEGIDSQNYFLVVTSLTRPICYQEELKKKGLPVLPGSSHERGLAFDLSVEWFKERLPEAATLLYEVLREGAEEELLNFVDESFVGAYHVCPSPRFVSMIAARARQEPALSH